MDNSRLLLSAQMRTNRQTQYLTVNSFCYRECPYAEGQLGIGRLQVRRNRIMNHRADAGLLQTVLQCVALRVTDGEHMPNRYCPVRHERQR